LEGDIWSQYAVEITPLGDRRFVDPTNHLRDQANFFFLRELSSSLFFT
jgi:hypothetical protein